MHEFIEDSLVLHITLFKKRAW